MKIQLLCVLSVPFVMISIGFGIDAQAAGYFGFQYSYDASLKLYEAGPGPVDVIPEYCGYAGGGDVPCYGSSQDKYFAGKSPAKFDTNLPPFDKNGLSNLSRYVISRRQERLNCSKNTSDVVNCEYVSIKDLSGPNASEEISDSLGYLTAAIRQLTNGGRTFVVPAPNPGAIAHSIVCAGDGYCTLLGFE